MVLQTAEDEPKQQDPEGPAEEYAESPSPSPDCVCDRITPWCSVCIVSVAMRLYRDHPETLSVPMLKRRILGLRGREAALLLEFTKRLPTLPELGAILSPGKPQVAAEPVEEDKVVMTHGEAMTLQMVRDRPGIRTREIAEARGLARTTVTELLGLLSKNGHVRREYRRWFPTHDRPIGNVRPRSQVRFRNFSLVNATFRQHQRS